MTANHHAPAGIQHLLVIIRRLLPVTLLFLAACGGGAGNDGNNSISASADTTAQSLTVGAAMADFSPLSPVGGAAPYAYGVTSGKLPVGLKLNSVTGTVTGTPTAIYPTAKVIFSVQDANGIVASTTSTVIFTVGAASATISATANTSAQNLTVGTPMLGFSPLSPSGGALPYTFSVSSGVLPAGLSLNASTGAVTGTPTVAYSTANVIFSVKDANNSVAGTSSTVSFTVYIQMGGGQESRGAALLLSTVGATPQVSTFAGTFNGADGTGSNARMQNPADSVVDASGNLYVVDSANHVIRKVVISTGSVTTLAGTDGVSGSADGTGITSLFNAPHGITTDGTNLYVTDSDNNKIRKIAPSSGTLKAMSSANAVVTSLTGPANTSLAEGAVDGNGATATFGYPVGITTDGANLYVMDTDNNKIRVISPSSGPLSAMTSANAVVGSLTGPANTSVPAGAFDSATAASVSFNYPYYIATDGVNVYVADSDNNKIRQVSISTGATTSLTGAANSMIAAGAVDSATATLVSLNYPLGIAVQGSNLYVIDSGNSKIREINISSGATTSLTGPINTSVAAGFADSAVAANVSFNFPWGISTDGTNLYVADFENNVVRQTAVSNGATSTLVGTVRGTDGLGAVADLVLPQFSTTDGINLYVTDCAYRPEIRKVEIATGNVSTLAGSSHSGFADGLGTAAMFSCPEGITTDGSSLYVVDTLAKRIRKITPSSGPLADMTSANAVVTTVAGSSASGSADGAGNSATFYIPQGITTDGISLFVTEQNNKIRRITPTGGSLSSMNSTTALVTSLTGVANAAMSGGVTDGAAQNALFNHPLGITSDGVNLYVADWNNHKIRKIAPGPGTSLSTATSATAVVSSLTGMSNSQPPTGDVDGSTGTVARFGNPAGITTDGFNLYVTDQTNNNIRMIAPAPGVSLSVMTAGTAVVSSLTGTPATPMPPGHTDGAGPVATFFSPLGITTDGISLYVVDYLNGTLRQLQ